MLMGGGFALARGFVSSGLSEQLGEELEVLESLPVALLLLVICSSLTFLTELTSNVAVCIFIADHPQKLNTLTHISNPKDRKCRPSHFGFDRCGDRPKSTASHDTWYTKP